MTYKNKKFTDLITGKIVEVIDQFEDIVIFDNKSKIKLNKLLDRTYFDEYIDPRSFFKNDSLLSTFTEKIRQLPLNSENVEDSEPISNYKSVTENSKYSDDPFRPAFEDSAVLQYDEEVEKLQLLEKAKNMFGDPNNAIQRQMDSLKSILEDPQPTEDGLPVTKVEVQREEYIDDFKTEDRRKPSIPEKRNVDVSNQVSSDPVVQMFKNAKRNLEFKVNLNIEGKIPRIDFIEMMEDCYESSIIDFLSEEFTNNLLLNPEIIKSKVKEEITRLVYKTETEDKPKKPRSKKEEMK